MGVAKITRISADDEAALTVERKLRAARHDINTALATLNLCVEFLAESSGKLGQGAVEDSRAAMRRIAEVVESLHRDSDRRNPQLSGVLER